MCRPDHTSLESTRTEIILCRLTLLIMFCAFLVTSAPSYRKTQALKMGMIRMHARGGKTAYKLQKASFTYVWFYPQSICTLSVYYQIVQRNGGVQCLRCDGRCNVSLVEFYSSDYELLKPLKSYILAPKMNLNICSILGILER